MSGQRVIEIVEEVTRSVTRWREVATDRSIPAAAQERMRRAFRVAESWAGR